MTIDDNKEALAMMRRALGSIENRFREAYNKGYHDGLKEGINQTTQKLVDKILEEVEADRKTENSSEFPNNCETCKHYKLTCDLFSEVCKYEPTTQTETQNSNLTFEKRTMLDCYNCKRFETEDECIECEYEPKDEPQTERLEQFRVGLEYHIDSVNFGKPKGESITTNKSEPQTEREGE